MVEYPCAKLLYNLVLCILHHALGFILNMKIIPGCLIFASLILKLHVYLDSPTRHWKFSVTVCSPWLVFTFDSVQNAQRAKASLNGADIYSGCCTLKIEYAKVGTPQHYILQCTYCRVISAGLDSIQKIKGISTNKKAFMLLQTYKICLEKVMFFILWHLICFENYY